jgi:hypothetical protein
MDQLTLQKLEADDWMVFHSVGEWRPFEKGNIPD